MSSEISISDIQVTPWNPRKTFDPEELLELQQSIQQYGILEPLIVRPAGEHYELVAGERRFRAAAAAGLQTVPVVIKELTDAEVHEIMLIENLQRSQLAPLEEAGSLQVLLEQGGLTQADLAGKLGKSQAWIANRLRLLQAPEELKTLLISREISPKHVIAALPYSGYPVMKEITAKLQERLKDRECSASEFERLIKDTVSSYQSESVFCLSRIPWELRDYKAYMNLPGCEGCKNIVTFKNSNSNDVYCLDHRCWKDMINKAKHKYEKEREKALAKMKDAGKVDTSKMKSDEYKHMYHSDFDLSVCHSCENYRQDLHDSWICLNPKCYRKKQIAYTKSKNKTSKEEEQRVWNAIDAWIDSGQPTETRWILKTLVSVSWNEPTKKALAKWGRLKSVYSEEVDPLIAQLSDDELWPAILRVLCAQILERNNEVSINTLKEKIPAAAEFYQGMQV